MPNWCDNMKVVWLIANGTYVVMFGDNMIDIQGIRFFTTLKELRYQLKSLGLTLNRDRTITLIKRKQGNKDYF